MDAVMDSIHHEPLFSSKMYVVVEFPEEKDEDGNIPMALVSSTWIDEDGDHLVCFWPSFLKTDAGRLKAVSSHIAVDRSKCGRCSIRIKYKSVDYHKAVAKLKFLEENSDAFSTSESEAGKKRLPKKKLIRSPYVSDIEDDEEYIPPAPKLLKNTFNQLSTVKFTSDISVARQSPHMERNIDEPTTPDNARIHYIPSKTCGNCVTNTTLLKEVLKDIGKINENISYLMKANEVAHVSIQDDTITVCDTKEEISDLENKLKDPTQFNSMVSNFSLVGGRDVVDTTRRILSRILSNTCARTFNWLGRNNKDAFCYNENLIKFILVCVRKNPLSRNATRHEIEGVIKLWLRNSGDRDGGRANRKKTI